MQETLQLNETTDNGQCRLALAGWIDSSNSYLLEQWLEANLDKGYKRVFLAANRRIGALDDCELLFANIGESVMGVLNVTGMDKLISQVEA